jgi:hypothetical protein
VAKVLLVGLNKTKRKQNMKRYKTNKERIEEIDEKSDKVIK